MVQALIAPLLLSCTPRPAPSTFRQKLDSECTSYVACQALVQGAIQRSKSCRENDPEAVSCAEARGDHQLAVVLLEPYERSAAHQARVEQEQRERAEAERAEARRVEAEASARGHRPSEQARLAEQAAAEREERLRREEEARAQATVERVERFTGMTPEERQQVLLDCYAGRMHPARATCDDVLSELLAVAASPEERQRLSGAKRRASASE